MNRQPTPPFLGEDGFCAELDEARYVILPLPFEPTVSWGAGTANGPVAMLEASDYVELYDEELCSEPWRAGIHTLEPLAMPIEEGPLDTLDERLAAALDLARAAALEQLEAGRRLISVGGEHSLTPPLVAGALALWPELGVVQFDAHADLRQAYHGTRHSHACAMARVLDLGVQTLAVGIRSLTAPEGELIRKRELSVLWGDPRLTPSHELVERFRTSLESMPEHIYLTFDVDWFDPAFIPSTGTPEPGGGDWYTALDLLRVLFEAKTVIATDVVELAPVAGHPASDFLVAKLIHKMIGYWER